MSQIPCQSSLEQALQHQQAGRLDDALVAYRRAIELCPQIAEIRIDLAGVLHRLRRNDDAIEQCRAAISIHPDWWLGHYNLGLLLAGQGKMNEAALSFERAAALEPQNPQVWNDLGNALRILGRTDEAIAHYRRAIALNPGFAAAQRNLSESQGEKRFVAPIDPAIVNGHLLQARTFRQAGQTDKAIAELSTALARYPESPELHLGMGVMLHDMGRFDEAAGCFRDALKRRPDFPRATYHLAFEYLLKGDFHRGWPAFESRLHIDEPGKRRRLNLHGSRWDGADLNGRTILIHAEQGIGDAIQFVRYLPMVARRGGKVILMAHPELLRLLDGIEGAERVVNLMEAPPAYDVHCPLMSLPLMFGTNLQNVPANVPYLRAPAAKNDLLEKSQRKVGITWAGRSTHINDRNRSISPALLAPLLEVDGIDFISLQKQANDRSALPSAKMHDWTDSLHDFADTAALIESLDLVISVDTAVAHLAGAMGKPVWVLLPFVPDWRWMLDREDSPWYPTMKLFRQSNIGDWSGPIESIRRRLAGWA